MRKAPCALVWLLFVLLISCDAWAQPPHTSGPPPIRAVEKDTTTVRIRLPKGILRIAPCRGDIVRITYSLLQPIPAPRQPYLLSAGCFPVPFTVENASLNAKDDVVIATSNLTITVSRASGGVRFSDATGTVLLRETDWPAPRELRATVTDGAATHRAQVWFDLMPEERLYGLGQHQTGLLDQRNLEFDLTQDNTNISIPFFLSSKGYGVFWNNPGATRWNNRFQPVLAISSDVAASVDYFFV